MTEKELLAKLQTLVVSFEDSAQEPGNGDYYVGKENAYSSAANELSIIVQEYLYPKSTGM